MQHQKNPFRGRGLDHVALRDMPWPPDDASNARALLRQCPVASETPLAAAPDLARQAGVAELWIKDERGRMGLGSFKALGAAHAIARDLPEAFDGAPETALAGRTYIAASAGNHGLSVAAGARAFGAQAIIYLAESVPESFARLLEDKGARTVRAGSVYEESMAAAAEAADANGWTLLSDSSWPGYADPAWKVMEGYTILAAETVDQIPHPPTHIFLQAGVGGLASATAAVFRAAWGDGPQIVVVEPAAAAALHDSIAAEGPVVAPGPVSAMGRLDCKEPSLIALKGLARDADAFVLLTEEEVADKLPAMEAAGFATSPSGGAGLAAAMYAGMDLPATARVLCILSEGPV